MRIKLSREDVIKKLATLGADDPDVTQHDYNSMPDNEVLGHFCMSGLFADTFFEGDIAEDAVVGLF